MFPSGDFVIVVVHLEAMDDLKGPQLKVFV